MMLFGYAPLLLEARTTKYWPGPSVKRESF